GRHGLVSVSARCRSGKLRPFVDREPEGGHRRALRDLFRVLSLELLVGEGFVLPLFAHGVRLPGAQATTTAQPCGFAIARESSALSRTSSATPRSRATSRNERPDEAASFTISAVAS